jgi:hypothetical protein
MGKQGRRIPSYIKGIPTNQKQLESKKQPTPVAEAPSAAGASNAFDMIQKRIQQVQQKQNEQYQTYTGENEYGVEFENEEGENQIYDDFGEQDGVPELELVDTSGIHQVSQQEHSVEFNNIQKHLLLKIGSSGLKADGTPGEELAELGPENIVIDGLEDPIEPSARIEHGGVDGAIDFRFANENNKYI